MTYVTDLIGEGHERPVRLTSYRSLTPRQRGVIGQIRRFIWPRSCFHNASRVAKRVPGATYVEGVMPIHNVHIEHAWNGVETPEGKVYIDLTAEIALENGVSAEPYSAVVEAPWDEIVRDYRIDGVSVLLQYINRNMKRPP